MPIRASELNRYLPHTEWTALRRRILERARNCCEGSPAYPECRVPNRELHPVTGSKVVLTVAHVDQQAENNADDNLRAWCQRCHLKHYEEHHLAIKAKARLDRRARAWAWIRAT